MNHLQLPPSPSILTKPPLFEIQSNYSLPDYCHVSYLAAVQQIVDTVLTEWLFSNEKKFNLSSLKKTTAFREGWFSSRDELSSLLHCRNDRKGMSLTDQEITSIFPLIQKHLPIVQIPSLNETLSSIPITFLCPAEFTHGVGRYITDTFSRWLIPGRQLPLIGQITLNFRFTLYPPGKFYIIQEIIGVNNQEELIEIHKNLPALINEMKINIMAVYHTRYVTSLRSYSHNQKNLLIQENLLSLLNNSESTPYDQLQMFMTKLSSEEKIDQVKQNLTHLLQVRPKTFDRETFYEIRHHLNLLSQEFLAKRDQKHLSRMIAHQYFFKKTIQNKIKKAPLERHLSIKITNCYLKEKIPITSILIGINLLKETERFEQRHLQEAIKSSLPSSIFIEDSFLIDRRHEKILFLYIEIYNPGSQFFTMTEIKQLRKKLPFKLIGHIETVAHSVFMPRNEEELWRNIIILANQIKYTRDLPQLSIHYEKQTDTHLFFTVILVRLKTNKSTPLQELFEKIQESIKIDINEMRIAGSLKRKYPKESAVLHASIEKEPFFRSDYSVDLLKARQKIFAELTVALGEFRDFNGGMIIQQEQALALLRERMESIKPYSELLLENYFYSILPVMMQTIYDTNILKSHFEMLLEIISSDLKNKSYIIHQKMVGNFYLCWIQAVAPAFKDEIIGVIGLPSHELTNSFLQIDQYSMLGLIHRIKSEEQIQKFQNSIETAMENWNKNFICQLK